MKIHFLRTALICVRRLSFLVALVSCHSKIHQTESIRAPDSEGGKINPPIQKVVSENQSKTHSKWKMFVLIGDNSLIALDNNRMKLHSPFSTLTITEPAQLDVERVVGHFPTTETTHLQRAAHDLSILDDGGCLFYITSPKAIHNSFLQDDSHLSTEKINQLINEACESRPTILHLSECYNGALRVPANQSGNRLVFKTAHAHKNLARCKEEARLSYWNACLLLSLPGATSWLELAQKIENCVEGDNILHSSIRG